ncbi:MAG: PqqD family protein [Acidobacteria bacterium]|nr:PqqD family protein [Acidobacteriota bacterium]
MSEYKYRINRPAVSAESFDNEVIIIHFESGNYYSLDAFGTCVWEGLEAKANRESILRHITKQFRTKKEKAGRILDKLIGQLLAEDLIIETRDTPDPWEPTLISEPIELPENAGTLLKFDDMKDLLLLDPIHDVDEAGWPHTRPESDTKAND